jgi:ADP-ribose pyrophosphatase YjhB (NUDIX family)
MALTKPLELKSNSHLELIDHSYCPHCGKKTLKRSSSRFSCVECSHVYFQNTAAATAAFLYFEDKLLMTKRAKDPAKGLLDLPGGFVDSGESAEAGLMREVKEELDIELKERELKYWKSFQNTYPYRGVVYHTCDLIFEARIKEWPTTWQKEEILSVEKVDLFKLDLESVGLVSIKKALQIKQIELQSDQNK